MLYKKNWIFSLLFIGMIVLIAFVSCEANGTEDPKDPEDPNGTVDPVGEPPSKIRNPYAQARSYKRSADNTWSIELTWRAPTDPGKEQNDDAATISKYIVYWIEESKEFKKGSEDGKVETESTNTNVLLTGLKPDTRYAFAIEAVNSANRSSTYIDKEEKAGGTIATLHYLEDYKALKLSEAMYIAVEDGAISNHDGVTHWNWYNSVYAPIQDTEWDPDTGKVTVTGETMASLPTEYQYTINENILAYATVYGASHTTADFHELKSFQYTPFDADPDRIDPDRGEAEPKLVEADMKLFTKVFGTNIFSLELGNNNITNTDGDLDAALAELTDLSILKLTDNTGLGSIDLSKNTKLTKVVLDRTNIQDVKLDAHPNLKSVSYRRKGPIDPGNPQTKITLSIRGVRYDEGADENLSIDPPGDFTYDLHLDKSFKCKDFDTEAQDEIPNKIYFHDSTDPNATEDFTWLEYKATCPTTL